MLDEGPDEMLILDVVKKIVDQLDELSPDYAALSPPFKTHSTSTPQRSRHTSGSPVNPSDVFYLDECRAFLQQVPEKFDLGTTPVNLNCLDVSPSYVVLGSDCGALFLYNRKINSSVRPLRTNYDEVVSCVQLYCSTDKDYLAVGHKSGTLILLSFPSSDSTENNRKLKQSIQEDTHRGQSISCVCWAEDGNKLFSADRTGLVMMCHVDFLNDQFINVVFDIEKNCTLILDSCLKQQTNTINGISFMYISPQLLLIICSNNGQIFAHSLEDIKEYSNQVDLLNLQFLVSISSNSYVSHNGSPSKKGSPCWTEEDFLISKTLLPKRPSENNLVYYSSDKIMFCSLLTKNEEKFNAKLEVFDFEQLLEDIEQFEVVDAASTEWKSNEEIFLLTSSQKVLRLARTPASENLTCLSTTSERPSVGVLLNSFSMAAQKSSRTLIERIEKFQNSQVASAGMQMVDNFLIGSSPDRAFKRAAPKEDTPIESTSEESSSSSSQSTNEAKTDGKLNLPFALPKTFALPEEYSAKIASNLQNIFGHLKTSNLMSDYDKPSPSTSLKNAALRKKDFQKNNQTYSSTTGGDSGALHDFDPLGEERPFEYNGRAEPTDQEINVNVARKTRMKRAKVVPVTKQAATEEEGSAASSIASDLSALPTYSTPPDVVVSIPTADTDSSTNLVVTDTNLEKILGVIGLATPSNFATEIESNLADTYIFTIPPSQIKEPSAEELDLDAIKLATDLFSDTASSSSNDVPPDESQNKELGIQPFGGETSFRSEVGDNSNSSFYRTELEENEEQKPVDISNSLSSDIDFDLACSPSVSNNSLFDQSIASKVQPSPSTTSTHTSSASTTNPQVLRQLNADYSLISRLINHLTDIWTQLIAPYAIGQMDVSQNYIVICPDDSARGTFKRRQRPHYRLLNAVDNGVMGGSWTMVKTSTIISSIAVNDESNLVWRIGQEGIANTPVEVDPFSPMSSNSNWVEQTGGKVLSCP
uniref:WD repeat-containing protein n=1 Tax=Ditylenchus dipsaci TaxID=166011 RepID=A0A915CMC0_9BILA